MKSQTDRDGPTDVVKATKRTPAAAYLAALIAVLVVWAAYRPLLYAWHSWRSQPPAVEEMLERLRSPEPARQREGLALAMRTSALSDEMLEAVSDLAFASEDLGIRQQAAQYLSGVAQRSPLPAGVLERLTALTPGINSYLATTYAGLIGHAAEYRRPPPNAVAFLDGIVEHGDWHAKNAAVHALGQIGFHHGADDQRIAKLTAMAKLEHPLGHRALSAEVAWALKLIGQKRPLPAPTIEMLQELMRDGRTPDTRQRAISAISTQLASQPELADAIEGLLEDPSTQVRRAARNALFQHEKAHPVEFAQALQLAADPKAPNTRRMRALQQLIRLAPADERVLDTLRWLARQDDPGLRAGAVSMAGGLPDHEAEALFERALSDADPGVRAAVVLPLIARRGAEGEAAQVALLGRLLEDPAVEVQRKIVLAIRSNGLNSFAVRSLLRDMATVEPSLDRERSLLLDSLERAARTPLQRFLEAFLDPENYGAYSFMAVAGLAVVLCGGFLIYFTARLFVYLTAKRWRALAALAGVVVWVGVSFGLGYAFFIGAFMAGGHNSAPPLGTQLTVVGVLLLLVVAYAALGYALRRLLSA